MSSVRAVVALGLAVGALLSVACSSPAPSTSGSAGRSTGAVIRLTGSDTMVNLDQAWAENYKKVKPDVSVQVAGGGSGVGIAGLIDGILDIAASSREMEPEEIAAGDESRRRPRPRASWSDWTRWRSTSTRTIPSKSISIEELAEIYGEDGPLDQVVAAWRQERGVRQRRDHPRQPSEQLRHLRLLPRGGPRPDARVQARLDRPERLEGRRGPRVPDAVRHRLQRHGLRRAWRARAEDLEEEGRAGSSHRRWRDGPRRDVSDRPAALFSTRTASRAARSRSSSTGRSVRQVRRSSRTSGTCPPRPPANSHRARAASCVTP